MSTWNHGTRSRSLILFTDSPDVADNIRAALASYQLMDKLEWYYSLDDLHQSVLEEDISGKNRTHFDLCLLAHQERNSQRQTLIDMRRASEWDLVPIVAFLREENDHMARQLYQLGANSILSYPLQFKALKELVKIIDRYWFDVVLLPTDVKK